MNLTQLEFVFPLSLDKLNLCTQTILKILKAKFNLKRLNLAFSISNQLN